MDIAAANWNEDDASNIAAAPDGAPEGMAPSGVNNVLRAMMGATKRWFNWSSPRTTGGTATAYTLGYGVAPAALVDGMTHLVQFHAANGAAATLNVNGLGAIPLHYYAAGAWRVAPPGLIDADTVLRVAYNAAAGTYRMVLPATTPTGVVVPFAGATPPAGYLLCAGQSISRTAYAGLFAAIGTAYGAGDGSTTFALPDLRGRVVAGLDSMGGGSANRLNFYLASTTLGGAGGGQQHGHGVSVSVTGGASGTLFGEAVPSAQEVAAASVGSGASSYAHNHSVAVSGSLSVSAGGSGGTDAQPNVQPTIVLNYVIRI